MNSDTIWLACALVLIFEGLTPFVAPAAWKRMLFKLTEMADEQIRFFALGAVLTGVAMIWWVST